MLFRGVPLCFLLFPFTVLHFLCECCSDVFLFFFFLFFCFPFFPFSFFVFLFFFTHLKYFFQKSFLLSLFHLTLCSSVFLFVPLCSSFAPFFSVTHFFFSHTFSAPPFTHPPELSPHTHSPHSLSLCLLFSVQLSLFLFRFCFFFSVTHKNCPCSCEFAVFLPVPPTHFFPHTHPRPTVPPTHSPLSTYTPHQKAAARALLSTALPVTTSTGSSRSLDRGHCTPPPPSLPPSLSLSLSLSLSPSA